jgi:hypothetical protein
MAIIVLSTLLSTLVSSKSAVAQTKFLTYENKDFGFSIRNPSDWEKEKEIASKSSDINIVASFVKNIGTPIYTEADFYIRTEDFLGGNITLEELRSFKKHASLESEDSA